MMKNFTLTLALVSLISMAAVAQNPLLSRLNKTDGKSIVIKSESRLAPKLNAKKSASNAKLQPQHEETFYYEDEEWIADGTYDYKYDNTGNIVETVETYEDSKIKTSCQYDANGMETYRLETIDDGSGSYVNSNLRTKEYDSVVKTLVVNSLESTWNETDWQLISAGRTWKRDISRDSNGNVTSMILSIYYNGEYEEAFRIKATYGDDGKADTWYYEMLMENEETGEIEMERMCELADIKWDRTNGQLVYESLDSLIVNENRMTSASVIGSDNEVMARITVEYEDNGNYTYTEMYDNPIIKNQNTYTITDENGSYKICNEVLKDTNGDAILDSQDEPYTFIKEVNIDEHGNVTSEINYEDGEVFSGMKYEYVYDEADTDYPTEQIHYEYDFDAEDFVPFIKVVSSDFVDVRNSIRSIDNDSSAATSVYNLQGLRLGNNANQLPAGVYIVKNGKQTSKIVKR